MLAALTMPDTPIEDQAKRLGFRCVPGSTVNCCRGRHRAAYELRAAQLAAVAQSAPDDAEPSGALLGERAW